MVRRHGVEIEQHLDVRELIDADERLRPELGGIEFDAGTVVAPMILGGLLATAAHEPDRLHDELHGVAPANLRTHGQ
jgi:hypothetical protein